MCLADSGSWVALPRNSDVVDPNFVQIGNASLINGRHHRIMKGPYGGTLSDYVPFYFTPLSPMFYNIKTGWQGINSGVTRDRDFGLSLHGVKGAGFRLYSRIGMRICRLHKCSIS